MMGYQSVTVQPKLWKSGRQPRMRSPDSRLRREPNWQTLASTLRWVSTTPLGSPLLPLVKSSTASELPPFFGTPSIVASTEAGSSLERTNQRAMALFFWGRRRSMNVSCRFGGQGKVCIFRTNRSAVR